MLDIAESEAKALLSEELRCINCEPWIPHKVSKFLSTASAGTVDSQGINPGIIVTLDYYLHPLTQFKHYKFSVFKQRPYGLDRVYQLEVRQNNKPLRDAHSKPHEHFGDKRTDGVTYGLFGAIMKPWNISVNVQKYLLSRQFKLRMKHLN
jgi:hypothetical protein